jgi:hypothetical protein
MFQMFLERGGCPKDYESGSGSSCWTAERIDMVRPLVEAAFLDKKRKKRHTSTPRRTLPPGGLGTATHRPTSSATRPMLSHHFQNSDTGISNSFDFSMKRSSLTSCKKQENQKLYSALVTAANSRFSLAKKQNNKGHYQTGKNWTVLAALICSVSSVSRVAAIISLL